MIRTAFCGFRTCWTLLVLTPGTERTNRCHAHEGMANEPETPAQTAERVRVEMGWDVPKGRERR